MRGLLAATRARKRHRRRGKKTRTSEPTWRRSGKRGERSWILGGSRLGRALWAKRGMNATTYFDRNTNNAQIENIACKLKKLEPTRSDCSMHFNRSYTFALSFVPQTFVKTRLRQWRIQRGAHSKYEYNSPQAINIIRNKNGWIKIIIISYNIFVEEHVTKLLQLFIIDSNTVSFVSYLVIISFW